MRKPNRIPLLSIVCVLTAALISGCSLNPLSHSKNEQVAIQELENEILLKNAEIDVLKRDLHKLEEQDKSKQIVIDYVEYLEKRRLVIDAVPLWGIPREESVYLNEVLSYSAVDVQSAAIVDGQDVWLFVRIPVYDSPMNYMGWIRESQTVKITEENVKQTLGDIYLKEGITIYEVPDADDISRNKASQVPFDLRGRIEQQEGEYTRIATSGGWRFWVKTELVEYPTID
ncbi:hypothetical protein BHU72_10835 [Desulfuribacillus stibiiarsenatis]|uniref:Uncharacterized protein n=1 Tax=Desulfuribacillus stibiiarsenatis TaxID=1390249 RepID=A0A1E5L2L7_9FIRM|nr:hypothetical protein [Desulfuribacillus stibiiarsenatis]OEH84301.1 hypothetical protein BHU72_10835 [Desulfuribacillus stibiiarsenatis]